MATRQISIGAIVVLAGLAVVPAAAQDSTPVCRNAGNVYKVGEFACIAACHGARRLARCDQIAQTATWTYVSDVCPSAHLVPPPPANASPIPTVAAMTPLPGPLKISEIGPEVSLRLAAARVEKLAAR